jgi:tetratricopeptide (TPR) repeat protein
MRSLRSCSVVFCGLLLILSQAPARADALIDAEAFIKARQYDKAIAVLEPVVTAGKAPAEVYNTLGTAYNWKKDYDKALKNYRQAAKLDKKFLTSPMPILGHFKRYDEMIQIGEAVLTKGERDPAIFTALLNAYYDTKNTREYDRILRMLKAQRYSAPYEIDYQRYVLAKAEVRAGHHEAAFAYIGRMKDKSLLQFMRTQSDFGPVSKDPRFIKMTK